MFVGLPFHAVEKCLCVGGGGGQIRSEKGLCSVLFFVNSLGKEPSSAQLGKPFCVGLFKPVKPWHTSLTAPPLQASTTLHTHPDLHRDTVIVIYGWQTTDDIPLSYRHEVTDL